MIPFRLTSYPNNISCDTYSELARQAGLSTCLLLCLLVGRVVDTRRSGISYCSQRSTKKTVLVSVGMVCPKSPWSLEREYNNYRI